MNKKLAQELLEKIKAEGEYEYIGFRFDERLQGDELLNAKDTLSEIANAGGEVDIYGNVIVYHRTDPKMKERIEKTGVMIAKEDGLFFSTKEKGQNEGYGEAVVKLAIPVEKLVIDDFFGDEIHFRYPLKNTRRLNVSAYLLNDSNISVRLLTW